MSNPKTSTNKFLLFFVIILCLFTGSFITYPSHGHMEPDDTPVTKASVEENPDISAVSPTVIITPTVEPVITKEAETSTSKAYEVSPEATQGTWISSGSNWLFMIGDAPYTGWLYDTDHHIYYFNNDGIMHTGWLDHNGKRYYFDADGIMQIGTHIIDDQEYHFLNDGSLKDYIADKKESSSKKEDSASNKKNNKTKPKYTGSIAITFDDGPSDFTAQLLDCLEANNAKATFFMVGKDMAYFKDTVKRMAELKCELGNHSFSHADLTTLSKEKMKEQLKKTNDLIKEYTGRSATVIRPPYGNYNELISSNVSRPLILWSVDTLDWETKDPELIAQTVLEQAQDGAIILLHDIFKTSVDAAEIFIPKLVEKGYKLVTVSELAKSKNITLEAGNTYHSF